MASKFVISAEELEKLLQPVLRQVPFIAMTAINNTLFHARKESLKQAERQGIAGGLAPYSKRALRYDKARKNYLQGTLYYAGNRTYMNTVLDGGTVRPKPGRKSIVAPVKGKVHLNKYGNLRKGKIKSLLNNPKYFQGTPPNNKNNQRAYGIWRERGRGKNKRLERVIYMNLQQRKARKTYRGDEFASRYVARNFKKHLAKATRRAIKTAR